MQRGSAVVDVRPRIRSTRDPSWGYLKSLLTRELVNFWQKMIKNGSKNDKEMPPRRALRGPTQRASKAFLVAQPPRMTRRVRRATLFPQDHGRPTVGLHDLCKSLGSSVYGARWKDLNRFRSMLRCKRKAFRLWGLFAGDARRWEGAGLSRVRSYNLSQYASIYKIPGTPRRRVSPKSLKWPQRQAKLK